MVQGRLLMAHPGSVHGGGEAPGGRSSLRQGAGKGPDGAPDLRSTAAAEQRRVCEIGFCLRSFYLGEITADVRGVGLIMGPLLRSDFEERVDIDTGLGGLPSFGLVGAVKTYSCFLII